MGNPNPTNPNTKPQDDKKQSGSDPSANRSNPAQKGEGRDPMKDSGRQHGEQGDQKKQSGRDTRKPA